MAKRASFMIAVSGGATAKYERQGVKGGCAFPGGAQAGNVLNERWQGSVRGGNGTRPERRSSDRSRVATSAQRASRRKKKQWPVKSPRETKRVLRDKSCFGLPARKHS